MTDQPTSPQSTDRSPVTRIVIAIAGAIVVLAAVAWFVWLREPSPRQLAEPLAPPVAAPQPTPTPGLQERLSERLKGVTLATSDAVVRDLVQELSQHPKIAAWLASEDLVRRFVAAVDNIATGASPRAHLEMMRPPGSFQVVERDGRLEVDPRSWHRYDLVTGAVTSIDADDAVALYHELLPLLEEAHREIAPPGITFRQRLLEAIDQLLATPVPSEPVVVEKKVLTYTYADPALEGLTEAQRHLLRMGPENERRIQAKLREIREALVADAR
jgi:hypothetical protein